MEKVKDLTDELRKLEDKDKFYRISATLQQLLAPQDPKNARPIVYAKAGWGGIERIESFTDGASPTQLTAPRKRTKGRKGEIETKTGLCWSFEKHNGGELLPWGGSWGLFKSAWRRTLTAKADRYTNPKLDLMKVYPRKLYVDGAIDSQAKGKEPAVVLETRHTMRGDVMVEAFFDYVSGRKVEFFVEVDSENPINEEKFIGMVKSFNTLDSFGPSKRGEIRIDKIEVVKPSQDELESLEAGTFGVPDNN